ncbi:MAG: hypothetical protein NTZ24_14195 [Deltaproteobacteria bacterium]|nr:hypothetical protein [Deltaproteobacteria bacterium]
MQELRGYNGDFVQIRHPAEVVGNEVHRMLYSDQGKKAIAVLPTYGFTSRLIVEKGHDEKQVEFSISQKWIAALTILLNMFPEYGLVWKLHPNAADDHLWQRITHRVGGQIGKMKVLTPQANATELIVNSQVIVTDVSTVFWFANLLPQKIVISLDIFGYDYGDEAIYYEGVRYFNNLDDLASASFNQSFQDKKRERENLPTLTQTLNSILSLKEG